MPPDQADPAAACPVDHTARQAWLDKARAATPSTTPAPPTHFSLDQSRQISTIPRATTTSSSPHAPANAESSHASTDATSANWIYPSERMFFDAMRRKSHPADARDMAAIVPIHNAVNERAWAEIRVWEAPYLAAAGCGGARLASFSGDSKRLTPRARWNAAWGYRAPFDRHDWVVDRCGTRVDYVIDFYEGKGNEAPGARGPSFYLDVRPKLNSVIGCWMRFRRAWGLA